MSNFITNKYSNFIVLKLSSWWKNYKAFFLDLKTMPTWRVCVCVRWGDHRYVLLRTDPCHVTCVCPVRWSSVYPAPYRPLPRDVWVSGEVIIGMPCSVQTPATWRVFVRWGNHRYVLLRTDPCHVTCVCVRWGDHRYVLLRTDPCHMTCVCPVRWSSVLNRPRLILMANTIMIHFLGNLYSNEFCKYIIRHFL